MKDLTAEKEFVLATYLVHGAQDFREKAENIAVGLTVGTWTALPREKQEKLAPHLGKVFQVKELAPTKEGEPRALLTVGYPLANVTADFPSLLTTVFGKLSMDGKIKLVDLQLPDLLLNQFPGPRFGIEGVRRQLGVHGRPLLMSIFKQCIGLSLDELEEEYQRQIDGGVDLVKDDEIFFRDDYAPVLDRVRSFARRNREREKHAGQKVLYAVNLTGPVTTLVEKARRLVEAGASCLLLNVTPYGLDILHRLAIDPHINVPIMAHPAFSGALYASTRYGVAAPLWLGKLLRWAGADIVLFPSPYGSVAMPREESLQVADYLRDKSLHRPAFPAPSAGIHPGLVPVLHRDFGNDAIVNAGGGVHGHPYGSTAGARAFRAAIDAVVQGRSLPDAAQDDPDLKAAIDRWGVVPA